MESTSRALVVQRKLWVRALLMLVMAAAFHLAAPFPFGEWPGESRPGRESAS